jgi:hypothetical protein
MADEELEALASYTGTDPSSHVEMVYVTAVMKKGSQTEVYMNRTKNGVLENISLYVAKEFAETDRALISEKIHSWNEESNLEMGFPAYGITIVVLTDELGR